MGENKPQSGGELFIVDNSDADYKLAQEGKIPGQKVGRHWRFHRSVIDRWLGDEPTNNEGAAP